MKKLIFILFSIITLNLNAQFRDKVWMLGGYGINNSGIIFNNGMADTFSLVRDLEFFITNASICDTSGNLLFYTNGQLLYNRFHQPMMNSNNFNPGWARGFNYPYGLNINQACMVLPHQTFDSLYYLFHYSADTFQRGSVLEQQPFNFSYSIIDMSLDSGKGGINSIKNSHIIDDTLTNGGITACKHANGRDWWVVFHRYLNNQFYKLLITPDTIFIFTQNIGSTLLYDAFMGCVFSFNGNNYALMSQYPQTDVFDFDRCTGDLIFKESLITPDSAFGYSNLGCAFSSSGQYLYVCNNLNIYQYDVWSANIAASIQLVAQWDSSSSPLFTTFYQMQLAPDDKIYISTAEGTNVLHVINNPDVGGLGCNVVQKQIILPWYNAFALPNHTNYELGPIDGSTCDSLGLNNTAIFNFSNEQNKVVVFPNPSPSYFNFMIKDDVVKSVEVFNYIGEKVASSSMANVNLASQSSGVYFYKLLTSKGRVFNGKLIKL